MQPYIFILAGVVIALYSLFKKTKNKSLKESGLKSEAIIFDLNSRPSRTIIDNTNIKDKVTIRFVTNKQEWITADIEQGFAAFFSGQYKAGDKITVYYDPNSPQNFYVDTKQSEIIGRFIIVFIGFVFIFIGLYRIFIVTE